MSPQDVRHAIGRIIDERMTALGLRNAELARAVNVQRQTIGSWRRGETMPRPEKAEALASALKIPRSALLADPGAANVVALDEPHSENRGPRTVPLLNWVDAGGGAEAVGQIAALDYVRVHGTVSTDTFALEVKGPSMEPEFYSGDIIIVDPRVAPAAGDFVVVALGNAVDEDRNTFKRYQPRGTLDGLPCFDLVASNPAFDTISVSVRNPGRIVGTVVEHHRQLRRR